ncbi:MAG: Rieske 2Fe-2S domain-containing protein [Cellvibrionaceae bacterium]|uniref:Rieske (2Fe-2S) protein n=1 Tax=uncultured Pseudoteredinibacter sp. TaxID=1641701 RepID=UPI002624EAF9|nr:Rieske 2Fe-2S domain-containing protein [uncultured Pseudoteredinibacter sp.]MCV6623567.1 Rieske 2Fe-2S domain-containing protein [Cellvibrionaceae bacterium]
MNTDKQWHDLPFSPEDIAEGQSKGFLLNQQAYFLVKKHGQVYGYENSCPHLKINLEWKPDSFLDFDKSLIQCSSHGALFNIKDGKCVSGPCIGQSLQPLKLRKLDHSWQAEA